MILAANETMLVVKKTFLFFLTFLLTQESFAQPAISSFTPESGTVGTIVTIHGTNFNPNPANNIVYFGAVRANATTATTTTLTVPVPIATTYQYITVTTNNLTAYSIKPFNVLFGGAITPNSFAAKTEFAAGTSPSSISFTDLDEDGKPELIETNFSSNDIYVLKNTGIPGIVSFAPALIFAGGVKPEGLSPGDINGDGKPDLVITTIDDHTFSVFINTSNGGVISFAPRADFPAGANSWPRGVAIGDLDGDGKPDLVIPDNNIIYDLGNPNGYGTVSVHLNTGQPGTVSFAPRVFFVTDDYPRKVFIGDLDGDNKPDFAVNNHVAGNLSVFKNNSTPGNIAFSANPDYATGNHSEEVSMGDLDGDGKADLVVSNLSTSTISVFRNTSAVGAISFAAKQDFTVAGPLGISIGDLDGDGKPDLAVASFNDNKVSVFRNTSTISTISFAAKIDYEAGNNPVDVFTGDADGDGIPDLSLTNSSSNKISVLRLLNEPALSRFTPDTAGTGAIVSIKGMNFTGTTAVKFGGVSATSFSIESFTTINAAVGTGATGNISVTTPFGTRTLGGFVFSAVTGINEPSAFESKFDIYPNPLKDNCNIRYNGQTLPKLFIGQVMDITGNTLLKINIKKSNETLDLQNLPSGIYILKFIEKDTRKFFIKKVFKL